MSHPQEIADIVHELFAEKYFFKPDVLQIADARVSEPECNTSDSFD